MLLPVVPPTPHRGPSASAAVREVGGGGGGGGGGGRERERREGRRRRTGEGGEKEGRGNGERAPCSCAAIHSMHVFSDSRQDLYLSAVSVGLPLCSIQLPFLGLIARLPLCDLLVNLFLLLLQVGSIVALL